MEAYKGAPCCKALLSTRLQARRSFSRLNRNRISEWKPKLRFRDVFNKVPARTVPGSISRPSCSDAREMISYIHARISEKQSNIEILIHGNSTPFLLRDTRAFEGTSAWNEYLKGGEREREREKEREGERGTQRNGTGKQRFGGDRLTSPDRRRCSYECRIHAENRASYIAVTWSFDVSIVSLPNVPVVVGILPYWSQQFRWIYRNASKRPRSSVFTRSRSTHRTDRREATSVRPTDQRRNREGCKWDESREEQRASTGRSSVLLCRTTTESSGWTGEAARRVGPARSGTPALLSFSLFLPSSFSTFSVASAWHFLLPSDRYSIPSVANF